MSTDRDFQLQELRRRLEAVRRSCDEAISAIDEERIIRLATFQPDLTEIQRLIGRLLDDSR